MWDSLLTNLDARPTRAPQADELHSPGAGAPRGADAPLRSTHAARARLACDVLEPSAPARVHVVRDSTCANESARPTSRARKLRARAARRASSRPRASRTAPSNRHVLQALARRARPRAARRARAKATATARAARPRDARRATTRAGPSRSSTSADRARCPRPWAAAAGNPRALLAAVRSGSPRLDASESADGRATARACTSPPDGVDACAARLCARDVHDGTSSTRHGHGSISMQRTAAAVCRRASFTSRGDERREHASSLGGPRAHVSSSRMLARGVRERGHTQSRARRAAMRSTRHVAQAATQSTRIAFRRCDEMLAPSGDALKRPRPRVADHRRSTSSHRATPTAQWTAIAAWARAPSGRRARRPRPFARSQAPRRRARAPRTRASRACGDARALVASRAVVAPSTRSARAGDRARRGPPRSAKIDVHGAVATRARGSRRSRLSLAVESRSSSAFVSAAARGERVVAVDGGFARARRARALSACARRARRRPRLSGAHARARARRVAAKSGAAACRRRARSSCASTTVLRAYAHRTRPCASSVRPRARPRAATATERRRARWTSPEKRRRRGLACRART